MTTPATRPDCRPIFRDAPAPPRRSKNERYAHCSQGHTHWGAFGAAGILIWHRGTDGVDRVPLQLRAARHGGTWGLFGGGLDKGETAVQGAVREAFEEAGLDLTGVRIADRRLVVDHGGWAYTTVVAHADTAPRFGHLSSETADARWMTVAKIDHGIARGIVHPGLAAAWAQLRDSHTWV